MCDAAGAAGAAISLIGSFMQAKKEMDFRNAENDAGKKAYEISKNARLAEVERQRGMENEAMNGWQSTLAALAPQHGNAARQSAETDFMRAFDEMGTVLPKDGMLSGQQYASDDIQKEIASRANAAAADARSRVQALARLTAFGRADQSRNDVLSKNADVLTTLNGLRRGSLGVSAQEQAIAPALVTPGSSIMGDLLSGTGALVSSQAGGNSTLKL